MSAFAEVCCAILSVLPKGALRGYPEIQRPHPAKAGFELPTDLSRIFLFCPKIIQRFHLEVQQVTLLPDDIILLQGQNLGFFVH